MKAHETVSKDDLRDASSTTAPLFPSTLVTRHSTLERLLREPLLHFLLLGALIFVAFKFILDETRANRERFSSLKGRIESLATTFSRTWRRPPTVQANWKGLIRDYVREEVFAREASRPRTRQGRHDHPPAAAPEARVHLRRCRRSSGAHRRAIARVLEGTPRHVSRRSPV